MIRKSGWLATLVAALLGTWIEPVLAADAPQPVVVFAAASLKNALDDAAAAWEKNSGGKATLTYAASNALAKQIEQGAPAEVFVSADREWMQYLADRALTQKDSQHDLLGNQLVLIAPKTSTVSLHIAKGLDLAPALGAEGRLALCNPAVPAGKYGSTALQSLGAWNSVSTRLAQAENVRAALALVARGEAPLGIVYLTDANAEPAVRIVDTFPDSSHEPIVYPIALLSHSSNPAATSLVKFLESAEARPYFEKQGFTAVAK